MDSEAAAEEAIRWVERVQVRVQSRWRRDGGRVVAPALRLVCANGKRSDEAPLPSGRGELVTIGPLPMRPLVTTRAPRESIATNVWSESRSGPGVALPR